MINFIQIFLYVQFLSITAGLTPPVKVKFLTSVSLASAPAADPKNHLCKVQLISESNIVAAKNCLEDLTAEPNKNIKDIRLSIGSDEYKIASYEPYKGSVSENKENEGTKPYKYAIITLAENVKDITGITKQAPYVVTLPSAPAISGHNHRYCNGMWISKKLFLTPQGCIVDPGTGQLYTPNEKLQLRFAIPPGGKKYKLTTYNAYEELAKKNKIPVDSTEHEMAIITLEDANDTKASTKSK